jgi:acetate kinase
VSRDGTILVLNAGSSSLKLVVLDPGERSLAAESISWQHEGDEITNHVAALRMLLERVPTVDLSGVGHRVVHGGDRYQASVRITPDAKREIERLADLAPLHNLAALRVIEAVEALLPDLPQVAAFDTAFHQTLPARAFTYAVPKSWGERFGVRRFGFHGLSHQYCAARAAALLDRPLAELRLVTCHLGSGCSLAAVAGGRSVATTMGFTPLDGVMMATRPGSLDPGLLVYLLRGRQLTLDELDIALNHNSGLNGVSGLSGDMRKILVARAAGHEDAELAFDLYVTRLVEEIAAMTTHLGGIDALVFTAGVGENAPPVRAETCARLGWMGVVISEATNAGAVPDVDVAVPDSAVRVLVIRTREELMVARETRRLLSR